MAFALAAGLFTRSAFAALPVDGTISAGAPGQIVDLPSGRGEGELLQLDEHLSSALLAMRPEESLQVEGWPVAPGVRRAVVLSRREIYAPDAKIFRVDGKILTEVPRSAFAFFLGADADGAGTRLMVSVDPATGTLTALMHGPEGVHEISRDASGKGGRHLLARPQAPPGGGAWTCGQEDSIETSLDYRPSRGDLALAGRAPAVLTSLHSAVVDIDTDNEYMAYWSNNTTSAANYIAQLLASINVMYERDLKLRLLQGTTFLRTSPDPYSAYDGGNAGGNELNEFMNYWNLNYPKASYPRSVAAMLSGKQSSAYSASGIAWLAGSVCGSSYDYSFSQLFKVSYLPGDTMILGHEIGHNLGSPHTHCYADPAPDRCYAGESCYTGPTSCPGAQTINGVTNVTGTLMGYCHVSGIAGCSTSLVFHPSTISRYVGPTLDAGASSGCLAVVGGGLPPSISAIAPNSGSTLGGTSVTITGGNFASGATVSIGGVAATSVVFVNATKLTATTGAHATGTVSVVVTNPDAQTSTLASGYFYAPPASATKFFTLTPCRILDTRNATGSLGGPVLSGSGARRTFNAVAAACGIPVLAKALSVNLTVTQPAAAGSLTLYPGNGIPTGTTSINFSAGQTRANNGMLYLATDGTGSFGVENDAVGSVHFILDVNGYFQ